MSGYIDEAELSDGCSWLRTDRILKFRGKPSKPMPELREAVWNKCVDYLNDEQHELALALWSIDKDSRFWNHIRELHLVMGPEIQFTRREVMTAAGIGIDTYYKELKLLTDSGAYKYLPGTVDDNPKLRTRSKLVINDPSALPQNNNISMVVLYGTVAGQSYFRSPLVVTSVRSVSGDMSDGELSVFSEDEEFTRLSFAEFFHQEPRLEYGKGQARARITREFKKRLNAAGLSHLSEVIEIEGDNWVKAKPKKFKVVSLAKSAPKYYKRKEMVQTVKYTFEHLHMLNQIKVEMGAQIATDSVVQTVLCQYERSAYDDSWMQLSPGDKSCWLPLPPTKQGPIPEEIMLGSYKPSLEESFDCDQCSDFLCEHLWPTTEPSKGRLVFKDPPEGYEAWELDRWMQEQLEGAMK